jgi:hypothetical protein
MKLRAAQNLANVVKTPTPEKIIPSPFEDWIADLVAEAIK